MDSINFIANFVKGNENDYMLVNDDGTIDGIGTSFMDVFGIKITKLPISMICPQSH